jgi:signal transduction histidine kinase
MSSRANVIELPVRHELEGRDSLEHGLVLALATADDLASGMDAVVGRIRRDSGAARAEWWAEDEDGAHELVAVDGIARGGCHSLPFGPAGVFVLYGGRLDRQVESALTSLAPIIRRRAAEERLARTTIQLAKRNEALEDFAALVAHELKTPLETALLADDPSKPVEDAIHLVDALLEASRSAPSDETSASVAESLE